MPNMTDAELIQSYVNLLIIQFANPNVQPNAAATISLLAQTAITSQIMAQVLEGFALSSAYGQTPAVGAQLDILGKYVGAVRVIPGYSPSITYFGMQDTTGSYNSAAGGYGDATQDLPPTDYWLSTNQTDGSYTLSDAEMIQLILYLAAVNNASYTVDELDSVLFQFFGNYVTMTETGPMALTYTHLAGDPGTLFGIVDYLGVLPRPAGVKLTISG